MMTSAFVAHLTGATPGLLSGLLPVPPNTPTGRQALQRIEAERRRTVGRAKLMAAGRYDEIRADAQFSRPAAGGAVHSHPEREEAMHRDYDRRAYSTAVELANAETDSLLTPCFNFARCFYVNGERSMGWID